MIVFSSSFSLASPLAAQGPNNPVIGYDNVVTALSVTADFSLEGFPATNLADPSTAEGWVGEEYTAQSLHVDVGRIEPVDYVGIVGHNLGTIQSSIRILGNPNSDPVELIAETLLPDDKPALFRFGPSPFVDIEVQLGASSDAPEIATMFVGKLLVVQRRLYVGHTPLSLGRKRDVATNKSAGGHFLGRVTRGRRAETTVDLQNLTPDWYRQYLDPFIEAAEETPFFFAWRPVDYPNEVGYAWLSSDPIPVNQRPNGMMQVQLSMGGIVW